MSSPPTAPLDYAPNRRRKRLITSLIILTTFASLGCLLYPRYPALANWYSLVSLRRAALTHLLPPDQPAFTLLPTDTNAMTTWPGIAPEDPTWLTTQSKLIPRLQSPVASNTTLFLHQRHTPAGQPRLVALNLLPRFSSLGILLTADLRLFTSGSLASPRFTEIRVKGNPQPQTTSTHYNNFPGAPLFFGLIPWSSDFRLYPAQPDPHDPTKFSLPYTLNQTKGSFRFQLTDDYSVHVTPASLSPRVPTTHPAH